MNFILMNKKRTIPDLIKYIKYDKFKTLLKHIYIKYNVNVIITSWAYYRPKKNYRNVFYIILSNRNISPQYKKRSNSLYINFFLRSDKCKPIDIFYYMENQLEKYIIKNLNYIK